MKSTAKATEKRSRTVVVLAIAVALMLLGSIFAQMFNTSFYKVKVSRISFDTDSGTLSGLLYMPKGVDASNPHPTIVTTHGYLNSAEMQDETAIEMSRRGYVVLALDMYDHGHSHGNADNTGGFFNFWPTSLWDAAQYMYSQDYVAKDAQGNGQIAVSGHSMGGFSSEMAIYLDEQNYAAAGYRIIKAGLSMGADYSWTSYLGLDEEAAVATFGGRTIGKICGQYDEFFFAADEPPTKSGTVYHKDYVATTAGKTLLEQEAPQADTWYTGSDGGEGQLHQQQGKRCQHEQEAHQSDQLKDFFPVPDLAGGSNVLHQTGLVGKCSGVELDGILGGSLGEVVPGVDLTRLVNDALTAVRAMGAHAHSADRKVDVVTDNDDMGGIDMIEPSRLGDGKTGGAH